jgi:hypothetical protein
MNILRRLAVLCALIGGLGLGLVNAEGSPLVKPGRPAAPAAAPFSLVQEEYGERPSWEYGPKWGGFGSAYRDRYGYRSYAPRSYSYSQRYRNRVPRTPPR